MYENFPFSESVVSSSYGAMRMMIRTMWMTTILSFTSDYNGFRLVFMCFVDVLALIFAARNAFPSIAGNEFHSLTVK